jgi:hypothetical protein
LTTAIEMRTGMTVIERCSLSPCSHPLVDSVSGQPWPAITVPHDHAGADRIDGNLDFGAVSPPAAVVAQAPCVRVVRRGSGSGI